MCELELDFDRNEDFRNTLIKDSILGSREKAAMSRAGFKTLGDIIDAIKNIDDIKNLRMIDKVTGRQTKIRNLGEGTAKKIIPGLYREYLKNLDNASLIKEIDAFIRKNEKIIKKIPEFAIVTLDPELFKGFWDGFGKG